MESHEEFRELCAVSTSGDLTEEEKKRLAEHLAQCPECREALKEYQAAAALGAPVFAADGSVELPSNTETWSVEKAEAVLQDRVAEQAKGTLEDSFTGQDEKPVLSAHWNTIWLPFAAAIVLATTLGMYAFRAGAPEKAKAGAAHDPASAKPNEVVRQQVGDVGREQEALLQQVGERDKTIEGLRRQIQEQTDELTTLKNEKEALETASKASTEEKQQLIANGVALSQKLDAAQAALQRSQKELENLEAKRSSDDGDAKALKAEIAELTTSMKEKDATIDEQRELLAHDRDIRELMGARELYVAEVYDVEKDASTRKSYGRVFFTKGTSLIFYAYDLDRQPGLKKASTFQAWGQRGTDRTDALSLGVFYEDNASKKRWVVKFDDPGKLNQIDAVFVTVEPKGGSQKPSGKPFLFAYLKVAPNHP